ncbi:hypothetical protein GOV06_01665 [Candidatus Woesearchaeota archaeon]|nr:hypothetical protein [Candidatus Woesearchaeota archaeon]
MGKKLLYLIMAVLLIDTALAATVHGTVYSYDLEERTDAIVNVDSSPAQTIVSKDGTYSFELGLGKYTITASYFGDEGKEFVSENIKIEKEGKFILDLILFPSFEEEEELLMYVEEPAVEEIVLEGDAGIMTFIMFFIAIAGIGVVIYFLLKYRKDLAEVTEEIKKSKLTDELEKKVVDFIKKEKGRTTQKDIRKHFPSSEAKISLVITELESKGVIEKIKKGRGNVIVLK